MPSCKAHADCLSGFWCDDKNKCQQCEHFDPRDTAASVNGAYPVSSCNSSDFVQRSCSKEASTPKVKPQHSTARGRATHARKSDQSMHLALATLLYRAPSSRSGCDQEPTGCRLLSWCSSASRLREVLPRWWTVEILALVPGADDVLLPPLDDDTARCRRPPAMEELDASDCPLLRREVPSPRLLEAIRAHMHRRDRDAEGGSARARRERRRWYRTMGATLAKWHFFSMSQFDAILFSDSDVDLLPARLDTRAVSREWLLELPRLVALGAARKVHLVAGADWSSPINAGVLVVLPSDPLYLDGLSILHTNFSFVGGWNGSGSPLALLGNRSLRHIDESPLLHRGLPARVDDTTWAFAGGDVDQGFLTYMLLARHDAARYVRRDRSHVVDHFWADAKPWAHVINAGKQLESGDSWGIAATQACPFHEWANRILDTRARLAAVTNGSYAFGSLAASSGTQSPCSRLLGRVSTALRHQLDAMKTRWPECHLASCAAHELWPQPASVSVF